MKIHKSKKMDLTFFSKDREKGKQRVGGEVSIFLTLSTPTVGSVISERYPDS